MDISPLETANAEDFPTIRQQSTFVENRVGQLLILTRELDRTDVRILAMSVVHSVDCAICRMILDDPDRGYDALKAGGFQVSECELLVVRLPHGKRGLLHTWATLLGGEVNIHYTYPLLIRPENAAAIAVLPDNIEQAITVLRDRKFELLTQADLLKYRYG